MRLDIDDDLIALENNHKLLVELDHYKDRIGNEGICKESGLGLESLLGGSIQGIDTRKLTTLPSNTNKQLALEAINLKQIASMILGFGLVFTVIIKIFSWLFGSTGGGGGGGGGSSTSREARELEKKAEKKLDEAMETLQRQREGILTNPEQAIKEKMQNAGAYTTVPHTAEVLMAMVTNDKRYNSDQAILWYARLSVWFTKIFPDCTDADVARANGDLAFYSMMYLIMNPDCKISFAFCAFLDKVPCLTIKQAEELFEDPKQGDKSFAWVPRDGAHKQRLDRYFRPKDQESAAGMIEAIEAIVNDSNYLLEQLTRYPDKTPEELYEDPEFEKISMRVFRGFYGKDQQVTRYIESNPKLHNRISQFRPGDEPFESPIEFMLNVGLTTPKYKHIQNLRPNAPYPPSLNTRIWNYTFKALRTYPIQGNLPKALNRAQDNFPLALDNYHELIKFCWREAPRSDLERAAEQGMSRELARFNHSVHVMAKRVEDKAREGRKISEQMIRAKRRMSWHPSTEYNGDVMYVLRLFLDAAMYGAQDLSDYCRNIDDAQRASVDLTKILQMANT